MNNKGIIQKGVLYRHIIIRCGMGFSMNDILTSTYIFSEETYNFLTKNDIKLFEDMEMGEFVSIGEFYQYEGGNIAELSYDFYAVCDDNTFCKLKLIT